MPPEHLVNVDEIPVRPGQSMAHTWGLPGERGRQQDVDEKLRFTTVMGLCGDGQPLPLAFVVYCSTISPDQSNTRVLDSLMSGNNKSQLTTGLFTV